MGGYDGAGTPSYLADALRLEAVTTSVGFDDMLDATLAANHPHLDTMIVVTSHQDRRTQMVAEKHGAICVQTDLFRKNGRGFNKGAAINAGFGRYQYYGWRMHLDADIALPDNFRRVLFNHTHLDPSAIYGADRVNVVGRKALREVLARPQHRHGCLMDCAAGPVGGRYIDTLHGYVPLGFLQLWHASVQKRYPYSLGTAEHDDVMYAIQWPHSHRVHLPGVVVYQLCGRTPEWGENWDGHRRQPRVDR